MGHDVLISYQSQDQQVAFAVCAALEKRALQCWIAPRDVMPGAHYAREIVDAIKASRVMVVIFSSSANDSPHVATEISLAKNLRLPIIPLRVEDVEPSGDMAFFLNMPQWLDALTLPLDPHLHSLADTVEAWLGRAQSKKAKALATPAVPQKPKGQAPKTLSTYVERVRKECAQRFSTNLIRPDRVYVPQHAGAIRSPRVELDLANVAGAFWSGKRRRVAILGNYGMGKSYFTWRVTLDQIDRLDKEREQKIPVLFPLMRFSYQEAAQSGWNRDIVQQILEYAISLEFPKIERKLFIRWIEDGVVGIILDGLDELVLPRTAKWQDVVAPLLAIDCVHLLVTSRTAFLDDPPRELSSYEGYELMPWGEREWQRYLEASEAALRSVGGPKALIEALGRRPKLASLTTRPLWCYMIVAIADEVPGLEDLALSGLYQQFLDRAVKERPFMDALLSLPWQYCAMERFAEECVRSGEEFLEEKKLLSILSGLFESIGYGELRGYLTKQVRQYAFLNCDLDRHYNFGHQSFEDYFIAAGAARWLAEQATGESSAPPRFSPREPLVARRRLSDGQSSFLTGILQEEWIQKSLSLVPEAAAKHLHSKILLFLQNELSKEDIGAVLRVNLFRLGLDLMRASGDVVFRAISLKGSNLSGMDLSHCVFEKVDFTDAVLARTRFLGSRFPGSIFFGAAVDGADFRGADFAEADLRGIQVGGDRPLLRDVTGVDKAKTTPRELRKVFSS